MALMWWDDAWAVVALLADVASLSTIVLQQRTLQASSKTIVESAPRRDY